MEIKNVKAIAESEEFKTWLAYTERIHHDWLTAYCPNLTEYRPPKEIKVGRKYIKVICDDSVFAFVDGAGNILRPASSTAPAKHSRGNIFNEDNGHGCVNSHGIAYLK